MNLTIEQKLHYVLRLGIAMCFIGHGAFGIITKPIWCNYFAVFGIGQQQAYQLMPIVGTVDVMLGIIMFIYPIRAIAFWLVFWGIVTALLRPLSGEPFAEFIERAGNFGTPLCFLILSSSGKLNLKSLFIRVKSDIRVSEKSLQHLFMALRVIVFLLLAGHGWLNLIEKKGLITQYMALDISNPNYAAQVIGIVEIAAAFMVLLRPFHQLLFCLLIWKIGSEFFYPKYELFEWIERGGSYCSLFALWLLAFHWSVPAAQWKGFKKYYTGFSHRYFSLFLSTLKIKKQAV